MINVIISLIILAVVGFAVYYIVKAKKKGVKCIGCPAAGGCAKCTCGTSGRNK